MSDVNHSEEQSAFEEMVESVANDVSGIVETLLLDEYDQTVRDLEVTVIDTREPTSDRRGFTLDFNYILIPEESNEASEEGSED